MASQSNSFQMKLLHPKHWLVWLLLGLVFVVTCLPAKVRYALFSRLGKLAYARSTKRQDVVTTNLKLFFPEASDAQRDAWAASYAKHAGFAMSEIAWIWFRSLKTIKARTTLVGEQYLQDARSQDRPIMFLVAHNLFVEYGAFRMAQEVPCTGIFNTFKNPVLDWLVLRQRQKLSDHVLRRQSGNTVDQIISLGKEGVNIFHALDEDLGVKRSVFAPMFGKPKATIANIGHILRETQAIVVPCGAHYDKSTNKIIITLDKPVDLDEVIEDPVEVATRVNQAYEVIIARHPDQYMLNLKLFRHRPEGDEHSFYKSRDEL